MTCSAPFFSPNCHTETCALGPGPRPTELAHHGPPNDNEPFARSPRDLTSRFLEQMGSSVGQGPSLCSVLTAPRTMGPWAMTGRSLHTNPKQPPPSLCGAQKATGGCMTSPHGPAQTGGTRPGAPPFQGREPLPLQQARPAAFEIKEPFYCNKAANIPGPACLYLR